MPPRRIMNTIEICPATEDNWLKLLRHLSPKNEKDNYKNGDEFCFDISRITSNADDIDITNCYVMMTEDKFDENTSLMCQTTEDVPRAVPFLRSQRASHISRDVYEELSRQLPDITFRVSRSIADIGYNYINLEYHNGELKVRHFSADLLNDE